MARIGIRELRQNASEYVRRAEKGEVIEVTDRGRPVARENLRPGEAAGGGADAHRHRQRLSHGAERGMVRAGR